jgi:hypothetical protein
MTSRCWTAPRPINVYIIEHRRGIVLFDTGQDRHSVLDPSYFPGGFAGFAYDRLAKFDIDSDSTLSAMLSGLGYSLSDVRIVILSHLHQDHIGGLPDLTRARVILSRPEWEAMRKPRSVYDGYLRDAAFEKYAIDTMRTHRAARIAMDVRGVGAHRRPGPVSVHARARSVRRRKHRDRGDSRPYRRLSLGRHPAPGPVANRALRRPDLRRSPVGAGQSPRRRKSAATSSLDLAGETSSGELTLAWPFWPRTTLVRRRRWIGSLPMQITDAPRRRLRPAEGAL